MPGRGQGSHEKLQPGRVSQTLARENTKAEESSVTPVQVGGNPWHLAPQGLCLSSDGGCGRKTGGCRGSAAREGVSSLVPGSRISGEYGSDLVRALGFKAMRDEPRGASAKYCAGRENTKATPCEKTMQGENDPRVPARVTDARSALETQRESTDVRMTGRPAP